LTLVEYYAEEGFKIFEKSTTFLFPAQPVVRFDKQTRIAVVYLLDTVYQPKHRHVEVGDMRGQLYVNLI